MSFDPYKTPEVVAENMAPETWKPNRWLAAVLGFLMQFLGMLYLSRWKLSIGYFLAAIVAGILDLTLTKTGILEYVSITLLLMIACAIHAFIIATTYSPIVDRPWYSKWYALVSITVFLFLIIFAFKSVFYEIYRASAGSMSPAIEARDIMLVSKNISESSLKRGDIVMFESPRDRSVSYVKRVVGLPGDTVEYKDKKLILNGEKVTSDDGEPGLGFYLYEEVIDGTSYKVKVFSGRPGRDGRYVVPEGKVFTLGDNRDNSNDSRYWGYVPYENLVGRVVHVF